MVHNLNQSSLEGKHAVVFGAGYIGGRFAAVALGLGARVTALTRNPDKAEALGRLGCDVVVSEIQSSDWHAKIPRADFVLNAVGSGGGGDSGYRNSYLLGTRSICRWASAADCVGHLVYTGSTSVYPQGDGAIVRESDPIAASNPRTQTLIDTELQMAAWRGPKTILRLAGIYGPERHHLLNQILQSNDEPLAGLPEHRLNLIHREDVVSALIQVANNCSRANGEIYNLADDSAPTRRELVEWMCERLGRNVPVFSGRPAEGRRRVTPNRVISNERIKSALGWTLKYPSFRDGFAEIIANLPSR